MNLLKKQFVEYIIYKHVINDLKTTSAVFSLALHDSFIAT